MEQRIENLKSIYKASPEEVSNTEINEMIKAGVDMDALTFEAVQLALSSLSKVGD